MIPKIKAAAGSRRVLVTGGGGFLGKAVVKRLVALGDTVTSVCRRTYPQLAAWGVTQVQGDIADPEPLHKACRAVDVVFHTAAKAGVWGPYPDYHRANVVGTANVIAACRRAGVPLLIHTSSPSVVFDGKDMAGADESAPYPARHRSHYAKTKALAEQMVRAAADGQLATICLRPHLIWGPEDNHLAPRIIARAGRLRRVGGGTNRVDTVYIDNAAEAHVLAARRLAEDRSLSGRVYFISQDQPVALWDMVNQILAAAGRPPVTARVSRQGAWLAGAVLEALWKVFGWAGEPPLTRFVAEELAASHWFDIRAAKNDLGYVPTVSIAEGLKRLRQWYELTGQRRTR
jgi:nucleoside-diphosphate-sugar epimerase